ncbi:TonB-dependent receptor [Sphingomonas sp. LY29]|uniref:TonB-dependent receptor n=1 Tax=Sphingomonas sp. LY29 TaxID=3095341 RepID=UPI002D79198B|nr:TonB-dependent receptor [Sphingomonas sp. LY29]WRP26777.1 TonB-dependent receptor [Sphingomonas sp. LY29]
MQKISTSLLALSLALLPANAFAQTTTAPAAQPDHVDDHHDHANDVIVTGTRKSIDDVLGGVSVVDGADLAREVRPSIGETLAKQPGVSATSFGPAASRPILRGLGGDRIRILTDGIGSLDLSSSSADHAVAINPLTADRVEILRGPSALLFGSSAIGGVVNVIDSRIPRRDPERPLHAEGMAGYGSAANERSASLSVDVPLGAGFVLHGDGSWSKSDDLDTGGYVLSRPLREEARASADPDVRALADLKGELPNSAARSKEFAGGIAYVDGGLNAGLSITRHTALYGIPLRYSLEPGAEVEAPTLDVRSTRYDGRIEVPIGGAFEAIKLRGGYSRYRHDELEESGEIGTSFFTNGGELRAEAVQNERGGWGGTSGLQYVDKSVRIRGEEKYLPDARQKQAGLFTLQSYRAGDWRFEAGARIERSTLTAEADDQLGTDAGRRRFTTVSLSGGALYEFAPGWRAGINLARSSRAPAVDELFANGPHAGTQAFEIGDPDLKAERSLGGELTLRRTAGPVRLGLTAFHSRFTNFIYQSPTGEIEDDLPVYLYSQGKARYSGIEVELTSPLGTAAGIDWGMEAQADAVRATIKGYGPAPQIPPVRLLGALTASRGPIDGRVEVERAFKQSRTAPLETETPGYTLLNASVEWHPLTSRPDLVLGLAANNIFDVTARRHSSLLKDYAPLAGRDIRLTARFDF